VKTKSVGARSRASGSKRGSSRKRDHIRLNPQAPFSDGVLVGDTLYLAGRIGVDETGSRVPDDIETEVRNVMSHVESVLKRAGMRMDDLVYVQVFCPDVSLWEQFNRIYCSYFKDRTLPARAFIGSGKLLFGAHFEVQGIAIRSQMTQGWARRAEYND
jgi:2-iminobutanoate/2-iminopropanoate deaminase